MQFSCGILSSLASQSHQWYSWGPPNMQCRLCASCWIYWKKYGGLKMPTQTDEDKLSSSQPAEVGLCRCLPEVKCDVFTALLSFE